MENCGAHYVDCVISDPKHLQYVFCKVISKNESIENENETKKFDSDDLDTENQRAEHPYDEYLSVIS